jgi:hypothetical protein
VFAVAQYNYAVGFQAEECIGGDGTPPAYNIIDPGHRHVDIPGQLVLATAGGFHEFHAKDFAGRDKIEKFGHGKYLK